MDRPRRFAFTKRRLQALPVPQKRTYHYDANDGGACVSASRRPGLQDVLPLQVDPAAARFASRWGGFRA